MKRSDKKIKIEGEDSDSLVFSPKILSEIVEARVGEIFNLVNKELKKISPMGILPAGVILTGGGAKLPGIKDLAKKELKLPCRIGVPRNFSGLPSDSALATVSGLICQGAEMEEEGGNLPSFNKNLKGKIKKILKIFIP